jgi:hypothetical protein
MHDQACSARGHGYSRSAHLRKSGGAIAVIVALGAAMFPGAALASAFTSKLTIPTHTPKVGKEKITVTAVKGSTKLSGTVRYQFLFDGQVVSKQPGGSFKNGVYHDSLIWPAEAVGHKITLQVVVKTKYGTDLLDWWIQVQTG